MRKSIRPNKLFGFSSFAELDGGAILPAPGNNSGGDLFEMMKYRGRDRRGFELETTPISIEGPRPPDVATHLRRIRRERGLSLEALAKLSGVSRAMLGQIETGKSILTITLIWKVAQALGIPATELIAAPNDQRSVLIPRSKQRIVVNGSGGIRIRPFATPDFPLPFTASEILIEPGHREVLPGAGAGVRAALLLITGTLEVAVASDEPTTRLEREDAILFNAGFQHSLFNPGTEDAVAHLIVAGSREPGM